MRFEQVPAIGAALMLAAAPILAAQARPGISIGYCGAGGAVPAIPIPGKRNRSQDDQCALACHAASIRKKSKEDKRL